MKVIITGSNSFLGRSLCNYLKPKIKKLVCLSRKKGNFEMQTCSFKNINKLKNFNALIHLAHDYSKESILINLNFIKKMKKICNENNINNIIYISSMAAHKRAISKYGITKYTIEKFCLKNNITIIRPAFIFGGGEKNLRLTNIKNILSLFPIVPIFYCKDNFIYSVKINELVKKIFYVMTKKSSSKKIIYNIFADKRIYFYDIVKFLFKEKKKTIIFPYTIFYLACIFLNKIIYIKSLDSLLGFLSTKKNNVKMEINLLTKSSINS